MPSCAQIEREQLLDHIQTRAEYLGMAVFRSPPQPATLNDGWPALVIVGSRVLYRHIKTGPLNPMEADWRRRIIGAGGDYRVWSRIDWDIEQVDRELRSVMP